MEKKINKKEIAELLGKSYSTIKRWKEEKLQEELRKNCWVVINKKKMGREVIYTIKYEEQDFSINGYVENEFNVKDGGRFMSHTNERIKSIKKDMPMSAREISEKINTTRQTCYNYDKKLEEKGVIQKSDDCYYVVKNKKTKDVAITTKEAYLNFWSIHKASNKELEDLYRRFKSGEISPRDYDYLTDAVKDKIQSDYYYYEVSKWIIDESNVTYQVIKEFLI